MCSFTFYRFFWIMLLAWIHYFQLMLEESWYTFFWFYTGNKKLKPYLYYLFSKALRYFRSLCWIFINDFSGMRNTVLSLHKYFVQLSRNIAYVLVWFLINLVYFPGLVDNDVKALTSYCLTNNQFSSSMKTQTRGRSRTPVTSEMEPFLIIFIG